MAKTATGKIQDISNEGALFDIAYTLKNLIVSYLISVVLLFVTAILATYLNMPDNILNIAVIVVTGLCLIITGFRSAKHCGRNGLLNGIIAGLVYTVILYLIGCAVNRGFAFTMSTISALIMGVVCGGLGGIIGINTKAKKRR